MKYPNMRAELVSYLADLADADGRQQQWSVDGEEFDRAVHFIYDDTPLGDHPERAVGFFLKEQEEVAAVKRLVVALEQLFEKHGTARGNAQVGPHPEWEAVKNQAREVLDLLQAGASQPLSKVDADPWS